MNADLLDHLTKKYNLKNDAAIARLTGTKPPSISKYRHGRLQIGPAFILQVHESTGMPIKDIKELINKKEN